MSKNYKYSLRNPQLFLRKTSQYSYGYIYAPAWRLKFGHPQLGGLKRENCQLTNLQVFQILLLLPFFAIKGFSHYDGSALCRMFGGKKDVLYSYLSQEWHKSQASRDSTMLDGNVLLRQKRDEVPEGTLSCPDRNLAVFHHYRHYEGLRLLSSVCDSKLIQQTLIKLNLLISTILLTVQSYSFFFA